MTIQILQYEFLGPIKLDDWGPPMEKVVYLIFSRKKDRFNIIYVGECEKTDKEDYFENNSSFENWIHTTGSKDFLYLAILPLFESNPSSRKAIMNKIITTYRPACNKEEIEEKKPDYVIRNRQNTQSENNSNNSDRPQEKTLCPCCGKEMIVDKILEKTTILKCTSCNLSDTRVNS